MEKKVLELLAKLKTVEEELGKPEAHQDQESYKALTQEHSYLLSIKESFEKIKKMEKEIEENRSLLSEEDPEIQQIAKEELQVLEEKLPKEKVTLESLLIPPDPRDSQNIVVEIRAGTGGDEAALFVGDLVRMYKMFADNEKWTIEPLSSTPSDQGGYKEYMMVISGKNVFRLMQYEAGTHRVQRVPETETQGRVHTSAATVAILLEPTEDEKITIDEKDLRIDTYRASGAGGQHVNVTDSAVRLTHLPTGIVVACQDERSQHKNKDRAMRLLTAKIAEEKRLKQEKELSSMRLSQIGSGERSERIRTYNFPQNRITDHRIDLTLYKLDRVIEGDLEDLLQPLVAYYYQKKLEEAGS
jgi:peptide chain release factor 1